MLRRRSTTGASGAFCGFSSVAELNVVRDVFLGAQRRQPLSVTDQRHPEVALWWRKPHADRAIRSATFPADAYDGARVMHPDGTNRAWGIQLDKKLIEVNNIPPTHTHQELR